MSSISISANQFRGLTLKDVIGTFTEAAYGKRLDFDHA
jgi:hypothetical protein